MNVYKRKTRKEIRNERAEKVCREVRWQIAQYGGIVDNNKLADLLLDWLRYSKKNRYERPQ